MKLRNKTTGEIIILKDEGELALLKLIEDSLPNGLSVWEEVKEPLIKDEKIREAVRAFAKLNNSATIIFELSYGKSSIIARADNGFAMLWVAGESWETNGKGIKWDEPYTIAELCGEEDE